MGGHGGFGGGMGGMGGPPKEPPNTTELYEVRLRNTPGSSQLYFLHAGLNPLGDLAPAVNPPLIATLL